MMGAEGNEAIVGDGSDDDDAVVPVVAVDGVGIVKFSCAIVSLSE
jgi:hypothetical protein